MDKYNVQEDTDAVLVQGINQGAQLVRRAIAGCRCIETGCLIAPGLIAWIFIQWHEFDIVIAILLQIRDQQGSQLIIPVPAVLLCIILFLPGSHVHLIDIHRFIFMGCGIAHPLVIVPVIFCQIHNAAGPARTQLCGKAIGVAMIHDTAVCLFNLVFVEIHRFCIVDAHLEKLAVIDTVHWCFLPVVEVTGHIDIAGIGRIGAEGGAVMIRMGTKPVVGFEFLAGIKIVKVHEASLLIVWIGFFFW